MHPTDNLVSLGQIRIARALAQDARRAPSDPWEQRHRPEARPCPIVALRSLSEADAWLARNIDALQPQQPWNGVDRR